MPALLQLHPDSQTVRSVGPPLRGHFGSSGWREIRLACVQFTCSVNCFRLPRSYVYVFWREVRPACIFTSVSCQLLRVVRLVYFYVYIFMYISIFLLYVYMYSFRFSFCCCRLRLVRLCTSHLPQPFAMNPCFERTSHTLGRVYKRSRRFLPVEVGLAYAELLLAIKPYFHPVSDISSSANVQKSRTTVKDIASLLVTLATQSAGDSGVPTCHNTDTQGYRVALNLCDTVGGSPYGVAGARLNPNARPWWPAIPPGSWQPEAPHTSRDLAPPDLPCFAADAEPVPARALSGRSVASTHTADGIGHQPFVGCLPSDTADTPVASIQSGALTDVPIHFHIKDLPGNFMTSLHMKFRDFRERNQHLWPSRINRKNYCRYLRTPWTRAEDSELRNRTLAFETWCRTLDDDPAASIHAATSSDVVSKVPTALGTTSPDLPFSAAGAEPDSPLPPGADLAVDRLWADTHIPELSLTTDIALPYLHCSTGPAELDPARAPSCRSEANIHNADGIGQQLIVGSLPSDIDLPVKMSRFYLMAQDTKIRIPHILADTCPALALRNAPCWDPYDPTTGVAGWARKWAFSHYRCAACGAHSGNMVCVDCQELYMKVQHPSRRTSDDMPAASSQTGALTDVHTVHVPSAAIRAQPDFPDFSASVGRSAALDFGSDALGEYTASFDFASSSIDSPQPVRVTRTPTDLKWQPKLYPGS